MTRVENKMDNIEKTQDEVWSNLEITTIIIGVLKERTTVFSQVNDEESELKKKAVYDQIALKLCL
jgi:hypothetical protein